MTETHHFMQQLTTLTAQDMQAVAEVIDEVLMEGDVLSKFVGKHILHAGGKRLRPMLLVGVARMCGYEGNVHIGPSACMELLHSASLLHDDVIDKSNTRRGRPTAHTLWGNKRSILVGDYLFAKTLTIMDKSTLTGGIDRLAWCSAMLAKGELLQLYWQNHLFMGEEQYLDILRHKTSALFSISTEIGGLIAESPSHELAYLHTLGEEIGMAFQMVDDILDYMGDEQSIKKDKGRDFAEKKMTYPMIIAIELAKDSQEKDFWEKFLHSPAPPTKEDHDQALKWMEKHKVFDHVKEKLNVRLKNAREILLHFEENPYREGLLDFLSYCKDRVA